MDDRYQNGKEVIEAWNDIFGSLTTEPCRQLVVSLLDVPADQSVPLPESAVNPNVPQHPEVLQQKLYHRHLPKLAEKGFIEWEREPFQASRGPKFEQVAIVFKALHSSALDLPDSVVIGCQRLEEERQKSLDH